MVNSSGMPMVFFEARRKGVSSSQQELIVALLSTCRALHSAACLRRGSRAHAASTEATVWEAAGAMLLGAPGCGRRSCATMAVQLAQGRLQRSVATEVAGQGAESTVALPGGLLEELEAFQSCGGTLAL